MKKALLFDEDAEPDFVARVTYGGYTPNPTDDELMKMGRDPFLISYALKDIENRCVVTTEVSKPKREGRIGISPMYALLSVFVVLIIFS